MAKLTSKDRNSLPKKDFALPGARKFPIPDKSHAANAKARATQSGNPTVKKEVDAAVSKKFPAMGKKSTKPKATHKDGKLLGNSTMDSYAD